MKQYLVITLFLYAIMAISSTIAVAVIYFISQDRIDFRAMIISLFASFCVVNISCIIAFLIDYLFFK